MANLNGAATRRASAILVLIEFYKAAITEMLSPPKQERNSMAYSQHTGLVRRAVSAARARSISKMVERVGFEPTHAETGRLAVFAAAPLAI